MSKLNYNLHYAISIRNKTVGELGWYDEPFGPSEKMVEVIDFRKSIEVASYDDIANCYNRTELDDIVDRGSRTVTREKWYEYWRSYRKYRSGYLTPEEQAYQDADHY
jgi:hypothetical protein